jgi:D-aminopeptidase
VQTVAVKEGLSRSAARCVPLAQARERIEAAAAEAVQQAPSFVPYRFEGPVAAQVVFTDPSYADTIEHLDFVNRADGRTVSFEGQDFLAAFERFSALHFLAPAVR